MRYCKWPQLLVSRRFPERPLRQLAAVFGEQIDGKFGGFPANRFGFLIRYRMVQGKGTFHAIDNGLHRELRVSTETLVTMECSRRGANGGNMRWERPSTS